MTNEIYRIVKDKDGWLSAQSSFDVGQSWRYICGTYSGIGSLKRRFKEKMAPVPQDKVLRQSDTVDGLFPPSAFVKTWRKFRSKS